MDLQCDEIASKTTLEQEGDEFMSFVDCIRKCGKDPTVDGNTMNGLC